MAAFSVTFILSSVVSILLTIASLATGLLVTARYSRGLATSEHAKALPAWKRGYVIACAFMMCSAMVAGNLYMILLMVHTSLSRDAHTGATVSFKGIDLDLPGRCKHYVVYRELPRPFLSRKACISKVVFEGIAPGSSISIQGTQSALGFRAKRIEPHADPYLGTP